MSDVEQPSTSVRHVLTDPHWWFKDVLVALIMGTVISGGSILSQSIINDDRAAREDAGAQAANLHREQLENLRFVRDESSPDPGRSRPFSYLNLEGTDLVRLQLAGADFAFAKLTDTQLMGTELKGGDLTRADLRGADMRGADLRYAYFGVDTLLADSHQPGADLTDADLTGANLTGADLGHADLTGATLTGANLSGVLYDKATTWPEGFTPPPSRPMR